MKSRIGMRREVRAAAGGVTVVDKDSELKANMVRTERTNLNTATMMGRTIQRRTRTRWQRRRMRRGWTLLHTPGPVVSALEVLVSLDWICA